MYCPQCDLNNQTGAFCKNCGKFLDPNAQASAETLIPGADVKPISPEAKEISVVEASQPHESVETPDVHAETELENQSSSEEPEKPLNIKRASSKFDARTKLKLIWDYSGVASRVEYAWFLLFTIGYSILLFSVREMPTVNALLAIFYIVLATSLAARRLRDTGFRMIWFVLALVPLIGALTILTLLSFPAKNSQRTKSTVSNVFQIIGLSILGWFAYLLIFSGIVVVFPGTTSG